jgi:hypothetical protein
MEICMREEKAMAVLLPAGMHFRGRTRDGQGDASSSDSGNGNDNGAGAVVDEEALTHAIVVESI